MGADPNQRSGIQPTTGIRGGTNLTAAAENPTEPEYRLCCDDVPEEPEELDVMEEPDEEPEEQEEWEEQTTAAKVTRKPNRL